MLYSDNSTQMYYAKLTIEESAIGNITELLKPFVRDTELKVDDLKMTTSKHFSNISNVARSD